MNWLETNRVEDVVLEHEDEEETEEPEDPEFVEHALVVGTLVEIIRYHQEMIIPGTTKTIQVATTITMITTIILPYPHLGAVEGGVDVAEDVGVDVVFVEEVVLREVKELGQHHQAEKAVQIKLTRPKIK